MTVWRNPSFVRLWVGESLSQAGEQVGTLAVPVLAITLLGASAFELGLLEAAGTLAFLVIGLPVGAWVDRMRKRRILITADLVRVVALLAIPVLWWSGALAMWHLYAVALVVGCATVFFDVTYQSYVPSLVASDHIASANSALETSAQVARVAGPAASGGLLAIVAAPVLMIVTAAGYLCSTVFVGSIRDDEPKRERAAGSSLVREIGEGLGFVFRHSLLRRITLNTAATNLLEGFMSNLVSLFVLRELGLSPAVFGIAMGVGSVGGILGALAAPWLGRRLGEGTSIVFTSVLSALACFVIPLAGRLPGIAVGLLIAGNLLWMFSVVAYNVAQVSFRQKLCPPQLLGRMNASIRFVVWGVIPVSAVAAGALATLIGVEPTMWLGAAGCLVATVAILGFSPLARMRRLPGATE